MALRHRQPGTRKRQLGAAIVEFAIVAVVFLTLLLGIMDFGRMLFTWNAAAEATRWGARVAVVCDKLTPTQIRAKMKRILPQLTDANIVINWYSPEGTVNNACDRSNCRGVEVRLAGFQLRSDLALHDFRIDDRPAFPDLPPARKHGSDECGGRSEPGLLHVATGLACTPNRLRSTGV